MNANEKNMAIDSTDRYQLAFQNKIIGQYFYNPAIATDYELFSLLKHFIYSLLLTCNVNFNKYNN